MECPRTPEAQASSRRSPRRSHLRLTLPEISLAGINYFEAGNSSGVGVFPILSYAVLSTIKRNGLMEPVPSWVLRICRDQKRVHSLAGSGLNANCPNLTFDLRITYLSEACFSTSGAPLKELTTARENLENSCNCSERPMS